MGHAIKVATILLIKPVRLPPQTCADDDEDDDNNISLFVFLFFNEEDF